MRYETQTGISDHNDWAPRISLAWAPIPLGVRQQL